MITILGFTLDLFLIILLGAGISFAMKLTKQLKEVRSGHAEMERFVVAFNSTVMRAEASVRDLKQAARSSGDDLEQLIEKGNGLKDELMFLTESADKIATQLSNAASMVKRTPSSVQKNNKNKDKKPIADISSIKQKKKEHTPSSAAEKELLRVLKKMG